jgi:hypothetical protein
VSDQRQFDHSFEATGEYTAMTGPTEVAWTWSPSSTESFDSQSGFLVGPVVPPQNRIGKHWIENSVPEATLIPFSPSARFDWNSSLEYFPLSSGVQYRSRAHQADAILDMCRSISHVPLSSRLVFLTDCRRPRILHSATDHRLPQQSLSDS